MTQPFIIWTMRRTGSTTLATVLMEVSPLPLCKHEPFNPDREFGYISQNFYKSQSQDVTGLQKALENDVCKNEILIKHCYEIHNFKFSKALLKVSESAGYKHIFLYRNDEFGRLMSLIVARLTGIWGKKQGSEEYYKKIIAGEIKMDEVEIERFEKDRKLSLIRTQEVLQAFKEEKIIPFWVGYDSLYSASASVKLATWRSLFNFLGFDYNKEVQKRPKFFKEKIDKNSQKSQTVYQYLPNWEELEKRREVCDRDLKDVTANYSNNLVSDQKKDNYENDIKLNVNDDAYKNNNYKTSSVRIETGGAYLQRANKLHRQGEFELAQKNYEKAIEINPNFAWSYCLMAENLVALGQLDKATLNYRKSLEISPNSSYCHQQLEKLSNQLGDRKNN